MSLTQCLAGPLTLHTSGTAGSPRAYRVRPTPGGDSTKTLGYQVRVLQVSTASALKVTVKVEHGPDGTVSSAHSTVLSATVTGNGIVLSGAIGSAMVLPFIHPVIEVDRVSGTGAEEWVVLELFETRKTL